MMPRSLNERVKDAVRKLTVQTATAEAAERRAHCLRRMADVQREFADQWEVEEASARVQEVQARLDASTARMAALEVAVADTEQLSSALVTYQLRA